MAPAYGTAYTNWYNASSNAVTGSWISCASSSSTAITISTEGWGDGNWSYDDGERLAKESGMLVVPKGRDLKLPDGTVLRIDDMGNVRIDDSQAKVIYQANRMREFNPFVNASDLLASFIREVGMLGLSKEDLSQLTVPLFINWLIVKAAEQDNDPIPEGVVPLSQHPMVKRLLPKLAVA